MTFFIFPFFSRCCSCCRKTIPFACLRFHQMRQKQSRLFLRGVRFFFQAFGRRQKLTFRHRVVQKYKWMATLSSNGFLRSTTVSFTPRKIQKSVPEKCHTSESVPAPLAGCSSLRRKETTARPLRPKKRQSPAQSESTVASLQKPQSSASSLSCAILKPFPEPAEQTQPKRRRCLVEPLADPETETRPRERMRYDAQLAQAADPLWEAEVDRKFYSEQGQFDSFKTFFRYHAQPSGKSALAMRRGKRAVSERRRQTRICDAFDGESDCAGKVYCRSMCARHYFRYVRRQKKTRRTGCTRKKDDGED